MVIEDFTKLIENITPDQFMGLFNQNTDAVGERIAGLEQRVEQVETKQSQQPQQETQPEKDCFVGYLESLGLMKGGEQ